MRPRRFTYWAGALLLGLVAACSPSLTPLYQDYEIGNKKEADQVYEHLLAGLSEAGWDTVATDLPNTLVTEEKTLKNWGLYKVVASLEAVAIGEKHVRLYIHPYRAYITGTRSKVPFLTPRLRRQIVPEIKVALERRGLHLRGTPFQRDSVASNK